MIETEAKFTTPLIHLNGTGEETLRLEYDALAQAINDLEKALSKATLHQRDFYPLDNDGAAWRAAAQQREDMWQHVAALRAYAHAFQMTAHGIDL